MPMQEASIYEKAKRHLTWNVTSKFKIFQYLLSTFQFSIFKFFHLLYSIFHGMSEIHFRVEKLIYKTIEALILESEILLKGLYKRLPIGYKAILLINECLQFKYTFTNR